MKSGVGRIPVTMTTPVVAWSYRLGRHLTTPTMISRSLWGSRRQYRPDRANQSFRLRRPRRFQSDHRHQNRHRPLNLVGCRPKRR